MRVVLDTNILIRAHTNARGPARELLLIVIGASEHTLVLSPFVLQELERVFGYDSARKYIWIWHRSVKRGLTGAPKMSG